MMYKTIFNELGFYRQPSKPEERIMDSWFDKYNMDIEVILSACSRAKNTSNPSISYINGIIEKPKDNPPSNRACVGRYILTNDIFDCIAKTKVGVGGEIQLTDAIAMALENRKIVASTFKGIRFDVGSKQGFVDAIKKIAEDRSDLN